MSQQFFRPRLSTAINVHGTKANPDGSCARTNNRQLFSSWFRCKSLRVRRGRCGNVCFHRHQNWVRTIKTCFSSFKTSYHRTKKIGTDLVRPNDVHTKRVGLVPPHATIPTSKPTRTAAHIRGLPVLHYLKLFEPTRTAAHIRGQPVLHYLKLFAISVAHTDLQYICSNSACRVHTTQTELSKSLEAPSILFVFMLILLRALTCNRRVTAKHNGTRKKSIISSAAHTLQGTPCMMHRRCDFCRY